MKDDLKNLDLAKFFSKWSKDPRTKIGAVIIGDKGQVISQGYNGFPRGIEDTEERLNDRAKKNLYVVHAEMNALYNAIHNKSSPVGATIYIHGLPCCHECAKGIIQAGIARVVMDTPLHKASSSRTNWAESGELALEMFRESNVSYDFIDIEEEI